MVFDGNMTQNQIYLRLTEALIEDFWQFQDRSDWIEKKRFKAVQNSKSLKQSKFKQFSRYLLDEKTVEIDEFS